MSLTLNMVGGGGGGFTSTDAILRVQAPSNSIVTITKGSTTKTDLGHENLDRPTTFDYYFIIHQSQFDSINAWMVTATRGSESNTATIIIDAPDEYDVSIGYHVPLQTYQEVEYIGSTTGVPYINTGATYVNGAEAEFQYYSVTTSSTSAAYGARNAWSGAEALNLSIYQNKFWIAPEVDASLYPTFDTNKHSIKHGTINNGVITFDGVDIATATMNSGASVASCVLAENVRGAGVTGTTKAKIFWIKLYSGTSLVRELYPCYRLTDSVIGMYDKVNNVFYTNAASSGAFVVGEDI